MTDAATISRRGFIALPLVIAACKAGPEILELTGLTMGTSWRVVATDSSALPKKADVTRAIDGALASVNAQMSNWDAGSEISRFNAARDDAPMTVSQELAQVLSAAAHVHDRSGGQFDITAGPLIDLWGFGPAGARRAAPSDSAIEAARANVGQAAAMQLSGRTLRKTRPGAEATLSAIGKGHGVDRVADALKGLGLKNFMVEIGGDLYAAGRNPDGDAWRIGIESPALLSRRPARTIGVSGLGMASSGDYRNFFEEDGARFSHIIDPRTGRPITHTAAATTVLAENAMLADAWSTAMLVLGREKGLKIAEEEGLAVLFIERDGDRLVETASPRFDALQA